MKKTIVVVLLVLAVAASAFAKEKGEAAVKTTVKGDPAKTTPGKAGVFELIVAPQGDFHMNMEAPPKIKLISGDHRVDVEKKMWGKKDAEYYKDEGAKWKLTATAKEKGKYELEMKARFVICKKEICKPISFNKTLTLEAE